MDKIVLHTRFNCADLKNKDKVFDRHDNVDRISYVDNTTMVRRFINEGKNLAAARAQALRSGMYSGDIEEIEDESSIPVPVYQQDAAIAQRFVDDYKKKLETSVSAKKKEVLSKNDDAGADAEVTASSPNLEDKD